MIENGTLAKGHYLRACAILLLATFFFTFEFVLQTSTAVMTDDLMRTFSLNALGVSTLSAFFYYGYAPMQLPGGLLYDRFGPRLMMTLAIFVCTLGAFFFAYSPSYVVAAVGRAMMGMGGALSFVGVLLLASRWFPAKYFAIIAGFLQLLGSVAAICGQVPLAVVVAKIGWRETIYAVMLFGIVILVLAPLVIRNYPKGTVVPVKKPIGLGEWHNLKTIFSNRQTLVIGFYSFCIWMPMTVFAALWGIDYLTELYHITTAQGAQMMAMVWVGVGLGSPLLGWWSEKIKYRRFPLYISGIIGFAASMFILFTHLSIPMMLFMLFLFGLAASGQALSFSVVRDNNKAETVGTALGFNNFAVVVGGALCQPLVGYLIHLGWEGQVRHGIHIYDAHDFQKAFIILPISFLLCALTARFFLKETHCRSQLN